MNYGCKLVNLEELPEKIKRGDIYLRYDREVIEIYSVEEVEKSRGKIKIKASHNYGALFEFELNEQGKNEIFIRQRKGKLEFIATGQKFDDWRIRMLAEASMGRRKELRKMVDDAMQV